MLIHGEESRDENLAATCLLAGLVWTCLDLFACRTYQDRVRVHSGGILQINDGSQVFLLFSTSEQKIEEGFLV